MTDQNEEEFFDSATSEFPAKEDLKDRLVAIWYTGKQGKRKSEVDGSSYPYCETVTLVLDDGPQGWTGTRANGEPNLVPSVAEHGPQRLDGFQWSATGIYTRAVKRPIGGKPMCGRINSKKNSRKGLADAWSIAECTDEDFSILRQHVPLFREIAADMVRKETSADDEAAFDA